MGPLQALARASANYQRITMAMPHLGLPGCERHKFPIENLPPPEVEDFSTRTKDPSLLCFEHIENGEKKLIPLLGPCSWPRAADLTKRLVREGAHPLDIIFATYSPDRDDWQFRNAVEMLFWTYEDQWKIDPPEEEEQ